MTNILKISRVPQPVKEKGENREERKWAKRNKRERAVEGGRSKAREKVLRHPAEQGDHYDCYYSSPDVCVWRWLPAAPAKALHSGLPQLTFTTALGGRHHHDACSSDKETEV